jgi:hypothetical protein
MVAKVLTFTALLAVLVAAASAVATAKVSCGGKCYSSRSCEYGFKCIRGTCKKTGIIAGGSCAGCNVCAPGLKCNKIKKVCESPTVAVRCGRSCVGGKACETGSTCDGDKCVAEVSTPDESCARDGCDVCVNGLVCSSDKKCTKPLVQCGGQCTADAECEADSSCLMNKCTSFVGDWMGDCDDGCHVCMPGYFCLWGVGCVSDNR